MAGETANFYDLVKRLRNIESFRHVKGLDVSCNVSSGFEYRYDRDDGFGIEDPDTHDTMTRAVSLSVEIVEKGLWESKDKSESEWLLGMFDSMMCLRREFAAWTPSAFFGRSPVHYKLEVPLDRW